MSKLGEGGEERRNGRVLKTALNPIWKITLSLGTQVLVGIVTYVHRVISIAIYSDPKLKNQKPKIQIQNQNNITSSKSGHSRSYHRTVS